MNKPWETNLEHNWQCQSTKQGGQRPDEGGNASEPQRQEQSGSKYREAPVDIKTKEIQEVSTESYIVLYCAHRPCCVGMRKLQ